MKDTEGLPADYNWFEEQIAGHHPSVIKNGKREIGILKKTGSNKVRKPKQDAKRGDCEENVYRRLESEWRNVASGPDQPCSYVDAENNGHVMELARMAPRFFGTETLVVDGEEHEFLILEDVTSTYRHPAILDVKMGRVTFDPLANKAKREKESAKYLPQKTLGFRLLGYRVHVGNHVQVRDKEWGKGFDDNVGDGLSEFFEAGRMNSIEVLNVVLEKLEKIQNWFEQQRIFHFYASSLLFLYETEESYSPNVEVYMIDFSHVFPAEGIPDENYIYGLNNLIRHIREILAQKIK